jgi:hypothetical protein
VDRSEKARHEERSTSITKQLVFHYPFCRKTSCNRVLERFLRTNDPRERLSVRFFPFRGAAPFKEGGLIGYSPGLELRRNSRSCQ